MAEMVMKQVGRVQWGPAVAGAFFAIAISIVLALFGAAFGFGASSSGSQGLAVLSGIWEILTPLVATFVGAAIAVSLARHDPYLNGIMVWCLSLAYGALLIVGLAAAGFRQAMVTASAGAALVGLATVLGVLGSLGGAAVGAAVDRRRHVVERRRPAGGDREYAVRGETVEAGQPIRPTEQQPPELRH